MKYLIFSLLFCSFGLATLPLKIEDKVSCLSLLVLTAEERAQYDDDKIEFDRVLARFPLGSRPADIITQYYLDAITDLDPHKKTYVFHFEDTELSEFVELWPHFADAAASNLLNHDATLKQKELNKVKNKLNRIRQFTKYAQFGTPFLLFVAPLTSVVTTAFMHLFYQGAIKGIKDTNSQLEALAKDPNLDPKKPKQSLARVISTEVLNCGDSAEEKLVQIKGTIPAEVTSLALNSKEPAHEMSALVFLSVKNKKSLTIVLNIKRPQQ